LGIILLKSRVVLDAPKKEDLDQFGVGTERVTMLAGHIKSDLDRNCGPIALHLEIATMSR
jgi:hypothetical protein